MTALPVRPTPHAGEPLTAYAVRLADANGIRPGLVLPRHRHDVDVPKSELTTVAALAGLEAKDADDLTMNRYPLIIRGHGLQRRHGWRLHHSVGWTCPSCTPSTGRRELLWQTALMPVCLHCGCYLVRAGSAATVLAADDRVTALVAVLAEMAEASIAERRQRQRLSELRRRCRDLASTLTEEQVCAAGGPPDIDIRAARDWAAYPPPEPPAVAALLLLSGHRLVPKPQRQRTGARSPKPPVEFTPKDRDRLEWFQARIRLHVTRDGLQPCHVPSMLHVPEGDDPARPGKWLSATRAAIALHLMISHNSHGDVTPEGAAQALGVPGIPLSPLIEGVRSGQRLRERDAEHLAAALDALLAEGLVDYQRRRDALRPISRIPTNLRRCLPDWVRQTRGAPELVLGWVWTRLTRGPMRSSPWPHRPDRDIHAFDLRLDPETRLALAEAGQQLLADTDLLTIRTTTATFDAVTRSYG